MHRLIKYTIVICFTTIIGLTHSWAADNEQLPSNITDFTAFFNQHYTQAVEGNTKSQLYIGALYENGLGVKKDLVLSHVYYNLASATGSKEAIQQRKQIEKSLSKQEFAEARKLAKLYKPGTGIDHPRQSESLKSVPKVADNKTNTSPNDNTELSTSQKTAATKQEVVESAAENEDIHIRFFNAVVNNNTAQVTKLVSSDGVDINYRFNDDKTALMLASELGNLSTVGTLLDLGANANLRSKDNRTALNIARDSGHDYIAAVLGTKTFAPTKLVRDIQIYLSKLDFNPGPIDGLYGSQTKQSLERFASEYKQSFPIELSEQQLDTLKAAHISYAANKANELKLQEDRQEETENEIADTVVATTNIDDELPDSSNKTNQVTATDTVESDLDSSNSKPNANTVLNSATTSNKKVELKKVGEYPDITGTYSAQTSAVFSNCGAYNQKFKYHADETIRNLKTNGKFEIFYDSPLLKCSGKGKFTSGSTQLKGNYSCRYETADGFKGTLRMKINGQIVDEQLVMKYKGSDTSPGVSCIYDWERTLSLAE